MEGGRSLRSSNEVLGIEARKDVERESGWPGANAKWRVSDGTERADPERLVNMLSTAGAEILRSSISSSTAAMVTGEEIRDVPAAADGGAKTRSRPASEAQRS